MGTLGEQLQNLAQKQGIEIPSNTKEESKSRKKGDKMKRHLDNVSPTRKEAYAPYNFVPLNESVVKTEPFLENDKYHEDKLTGYIDCDLKTLTPIYIRDTYTDEDIKKHNEMERRNKEEGTKDKYIVADFFSPNGVFRIPGSSLRGMIRTLVEIVSWSKLGFFEDRGLYYRGLADRSNLQREYQDCMVDKGDYCYPRVEAGFLKKEDHNYKIIPSKKDSNGCQIYRSLFDKYTKVVNGLRKRLKEFDYEVVYFQQVEPSLHPRKRFEYKKGEKREIRYELKYAEVTSVSATQDKGHPTRGFLVSSGLFGNKKHMHWLINEPGTSEIPIPECDIENYKRDEARKDEANLLKMSPKYPEGIPCFYIEWKDKKDKNRVSFGHTGMFRLAYEKSIGEYVPDFLQDEKKIDMAEAIFGKAAKKEKDSFAGRVFFEDAVLLNPQEDPRMEEAIPQILSTPKPTTFQHYLVQNTDDIHNLNHYNSDTIIRGNKLYWHKSGEDWEETDQTKIERHKTQYTKIQPVKPETDFKFRIRFENLSKEELGALLFALDLPEGCAHKKGCAHKIGMGKPLGLGSVQITPQLVLLDRKERYRSLFDGNNWALPPKKNGKTIKEYKDDFEEFILSKLGDEEKEGAKSLWDTYRLRQLKTMLDVEEGKRLEKLGKIRYMQIEGPNDNEFRDRKVLPIPEKTG